MEQETMLKEILHALQMHSEHIDKKFEQMNDKMDNKINELESKMDNRINALESKMDNKISELDSKMNNGFDRLGKKVDGIRVELTETQENTEYVLSKTAQHERKLRQFSEQQ
jgi:uncharacterized protein (DUF885 family)